MSPISFRKLTAALVATLLFSHSALAALGQASIWEKRHNQMAMASSNSILALPPLQPANLKPVSESLRSKFNLAQDDPVEPLLAAIPQTHARINDVYLAPQSSKPPLILIQDIHLNAEAQQNIAATLQNLIDENQLAWVGVEGAFSNFDFSFFRDYGDPAITRKFAKAYLDHNLLAAPSVVGITSEKLPPPFKGIDDSSHYQANVEAYRNSKKLHASAESDLRTAISALNDEKQKTFSQRLLDFDRSWNAYLAGAADLSAFISILEKAGTKLPPALEQYSRAHKLERKLNFARVEAQRKSVVNLLTKNLSPTELQELMAMGLALKMGRLSTASFYNHLTTLCQSHGISLIQYNEFNQYLQYVALADSINADDLMGAIYETTWLAAIQLAESELSKTLFEEGIFLNLIQKLINFELTPGEWAQYNELKKHHLTPLADITPFENFYREADQRSEKMVRRIAEENGPAAIVIGGFHSPHLSNLLRDQNRSYIIVSPKLTKVDAEAGNKYLSIFDRENAPLEQLVKGETLFISPMVAHITHPATLHLAASDLAIDQVRNNPTLKLPGGIQVTEKGSNIFEARSDTWAHTVSFNKNDKGTPRPTEGKYIQARNSLIGQILNFLLAKLRAEEKSTARESDAKNPPSEIQRPESTQPKSVAPTKTRRIPQYIEEGKTIASGGVANENFPNIIFNIKLMTSDPSAPTIDDIFGDLFREVQNWAFETGLQPHQIALNIAMDIFPGSGGIIFKNLDKYEHEHHTLPTPIYKNLAKSLQKYFPGAPTSHTTVIGPGAAIGVYNYFNGDFSNSSRNPKDLSLKDLLIGIYHRPKKIKGFDLQINGEERILKGISLKGRVPQLDEPPRTRIQDLATSQKPVNVVPPGLPMVQTPSTITLGSLRPLSLLTFMLVAFGGATMASAAEPILAQSVLMLDIGAVDFWMVSLSALIISGAIHFGYEQMNKRLEDAPEESSLDPTLSNKTNPFSPPQSVLENKKLNTPAGVASLIKMALKNPSATNGFPHRILTKMSTEKQMAPLILESAPRVAEKLDNALDMEYWNGDFAELLADAMVTAYHRPENEIDQEPSSEFVEFIHSEPVPFNLWLLHVVTTPIIETIGFHSLGILATQQYLSQFLNTTYVPERTMNGLFRALGIGDMDWILIGVGMVALGFSSFHTLMEWRKRARIGGMQQILNPIHLQQDLREFISRFFISIALSIPYILGITVIPSLHSPIVGIDGVIAVPIFSMLTLLLHMVYNHQALRLRTRAEDPNNPTQITRWLPLASIFSSRGYDKEPKQLRNPDTIGPSEVQISPDLIKNPFLILSPIYNEGARLEYVVQQIHRNGYLSSVVFINDGSTDNSLEELKNLAVRFPELNFISFPKGLNQYKEGAVASSFGYLEQTFGSNSLPAVTLLVDGDSFLLAKGNSVREELNRLVRSFDEKNYSARPGRILGDISETPNLVGRVQNAFYRILDIGSFVREWLTVLPGLNKLNGMKNLPGGFSVFDTQILKEALPLHSRQNFEGGDSELGNIVRGLSKKYNRPIGPLVSGVVLITKLETSWKSYFLQQTRIYRGYLTDHPVLSGTLMVILSFGVYYGLSAPFGVFKLAYYAVLGLPSLFFSSGLISLVYKRLKSNSQTKQTDSPRQTFLPETVRVSDIKGILSEFTDTPAEDLEINFTPTALRVRNRQTDETVAAIKYSYISGLKEQVLTIDHQTVPKFKRRGIMGVLLNALINEKKPTMVTFIKLTEDGRLFLKNQVDKGLFTVNKGALDRANPINPNKVFSRTISAWPVRDPGRVMRGVLNRSETTQQKVNNLLNTVPVGSVFAENKSNESLSWPELSRWAKQGLQRLIENKQIQQPDGMAQAADILYVMRAISTQSEYAEFQSSVADLLREIKNDNQPTDIFIAVSSDRTIALNQYRRLVQPLLGEYGALKPTHRIVVLINSQDLKLIQSLKAAFPNISLGQMIIVNSPDYHSGTKNVVNLIKDLSRLDGSLPDLSTLSKSTTRKFLIPEGAGSALSPAFFDLNSSDLFPEVRQSLEDSIQVYLLIDNLLSAVYLPHSLLTDWAAFRQALVAA